MYLYKQFGYSLPHSASAQYANCGVKVSRSNLQPGDLVFFTSSGAGGRINHVGIYTGNDQIIHARYSVGKVHINYLSESYYNKYYVGAIRIA
jgi:cell wall-associated NlpC family hydrolase